jgi:hypothetical protein
MVGQGGGNCRQFGELFMRMLAVFFVVHRFLKQNQSIIDKFVPATPRDVAANQLAVHADAPPADVKIPHLPGGDLLEQFFDQVDPSFLLKLVYPFAE